MANLVQWILEVAEGEPVLGVVIGEMGWGDYGSENVPNYEQIPKGKVLPWEEAKRWLDYEFDRGYGAPKCNAVYVWTTTKVIAITQYDGATSPFCVPRNPVDIMPSMPGTGL